jgi:hypothetical protein
MQIYSPNATFALHDSFLEGAAAIREYYAPQFAFGAARSTLDFEQFKVQVLNPDIVLVLGIYKSTRNGETVRGTTSLILQYSLSHWRIIHDHSS